MLNNPQNFQLRPQLYEFYGILMGDGCISQYRDYQKANRLDTVVTGDKRNEVSYFLYIKSLLKEEFGVGAYLYEYKTENTVRLIIRNKAFASFLLELGFPCGKKYEKLIIPNRFIQLEWNDLKHLIRGLFDTDGSIYAKKNEQYRYPYVSLSSKSILLLQQIHKILRDRNYPFYINCNENLVMKGIENTKRWMADVGTSNPKHKFKYNHWLRHGSLPARLEMGR